MLITFTHAFATYVAGGKGKGKQKITMNLAEFMGPNVPIQTFKWADVINEDDFTSEPPKSEKPIILPTAPKAMRGNDVDLSKVPTQPPFKAFVSNLQYETTSAEIHRFFQKLNVNTDPYFLESSVLLNLNLETGERCPVTNGARRKGSRLCVR